MSTSFPIPSRNVNSIVCIVSVPCICTNDVSSKSVDEIISPKLPVSGTTPSTVPKPSDVRVSGVVNELMHT